LELAGRRDDRVPLLQEREHRDLDRGEVRMEAQQDPLLTAHLLLAVGVHEKRQHRPVRAGRGLDDVGHDVCLPLLVEVGQRLAARLAVLLEVEVGTVGDALRSEEHTSELQSRFDLVCRLLLEKKKKIFLASSVVVLLTCDCVCCADADLLAAKTNNAAQKMAINVSKGCMRNLAEGVSALIASR